MNPTTVLDLPIEAALRELKRQLEELQASDVETDDQLRDTWRMLRLKRGCRRG